MDGDGEHRVKYISKFITEYKRKNSDVIIEKETLNPDLWSISYVNIFK